MQKKDFLIGFTILWASSLQANTQELKKDSNYKKCFVGSTFFILGNFIPNDSHRSYFVQLNVGYRITPKNVVSLEFNTPKFDWPLKTNTPESFKLEESKWPNYFAWELGLHFGFNF